MKRGNETKPTKVLTCTFESWWVTDEKHVQPMLEATKVLKGERRVAPMAGRCKKVCKCALDEKRELLARYPTKSNTKQNREQKQGASKIKVWSALMNFSSITYLIRTGSCIPWTNLSRQKCPSYESWYKFHRTDFLQKCHYSVKYVRYCY